MNPDRNVGQIAAICFGPITKTCRSACSTHVRVPFASRVHATTSPRPGPSPLSRCSSGRWACTLPRCSPSGFKRCCTDCQSSWSLPEGPSPPAQRGARWASLWQLRRGTAPGSCTTQPTLQQLLQEARRYRPGRGAGNIHRGGDDHRAKQHPSKNGTPGRFNAKPRPPAGHRPLRHHREGGIRPRPASSRPARAAS
jgi:hypothetical protein